MFYRNCISYLSLFLISYSYGADKKNPDQLMWEAKGKSGPIPITTNMVPTPQMPKGPEINPQYPSNTQSSNGVGSSAPASIVALVGDVAKLMKEDKSHIEAQNDYMKAISDASTDFRYMKKLRMNQAPTGIITREELGMPVMEIPAPTPAPEPVYTGIPTPLLVPDDMAMKADDLTWKLAQMSNTPSPLPALKRALDENEQGGNIGGAMGAMGAASAIASQLASSAGAATSTAMTTVGGAATTALGVITAPAVIGTIGLIGAAGIGAGMIYLAFNPHLVNEFVFGKSPVSIPAGTPPPKDPNNPMPMPNPQDPKGPKERKFNQTQRTEAMKEVKKNYRFDNSSKTYKLKDNGKAITCSRTGKAVEIVYWDGQHGDIEAWKGLRRGQHMGSLDPQTWEMYKGPDLNRTLL